MTKLLKMTKLFILFYSNIGMSYSLNSNKQMNWRHFFLKLKTYFLFKFLDLTEHNAIAFFLALKVLIFIIFIVKNFVYILI